MEEGATGGSRVVQESLHQLLSENFVKNSQNKKRIGHRGHGGYVWE